MGEHAAHDGGSVVVPARWSRSERLRASAPLAVASACLTLVYGGLLANDGPVTGPWLDYLSPDVVPLDRMLNGALWLAALVEIAAGGPAWLRARSARSRAAIAALFGGVMFYVLRDTRCELGDGPALVRDPVGAVVGGGYYTFVEELAGMWLPLRLAQVRYHAGVPPVAAIVEGYRIVSIGFGMLYAAAVTLAARNTDAPRRFALLMFGHAALLLFMGYVENYVGAFTLLALGFLRATDALRRGLAAPACTLGTTALCALAVLFHGVAVWSVLALVVLAAYTESGPNRALGFVKTASANAALGLAILAAGYFLFHAYLTPGVTTVHVTPVLRGGDALPFATSFGALAAVRPLREQALALLRVGSPALVAISTAAIAVPKPVASLLRARDIRFALAFLLGFLAHQLVWRSTLGTYRDWDLFGFTALPLAYLGARASALLPRGHVVYALLLACCTLAGLSWPLTQTGSALSPRDRVPAPWER